MKKIIAILLLVVFATAFSGCARNDENTLYFLRSTAVSVMASAAMPQTTPNITHAITGLVFLSSDSISGVYVPAIIKYIVQWSSTCITFFAITGFSPWYTLDIVKSAITEAP